MLINTFIQTGRNVMIILDSLKRGCSCTKEDLAGDSADKRSLVYDRKQTFP
jgi:hypothetical protein